MPNVAALLSSVRTAPYLVTDCGGHTWFATRGSLEWQWQTRPSREMHSTGVPGAQCNESPPPAQHHFLIAPARNTYSAFVAGLSDSAAAAGLGDDRKARPHADTGRPAGPRTVTSGPLRPQIREDDICGGPEPPVERWIGLSPWAPGVMATPSHARLFRPEWLSKPRRSARRRAQLAGAPAGRCGAGPDTQGGSVMRRLCVLVLGVMISAAAGCATGGSCACYEPGDRSFRPGAADYPAPIVAPAPAAHQ